MPTINGSDVKSVIVACEAGMGSSVLLTSQLSSKLSGHGVNVTHSPVNRLTDETGDVIVCHQGLAARARQAAPNTPIVTFMVFMGDPAFARLESAIATGGDIDG